MNIVALTPFISIIIPGDKKDVLGNLPYRSKSPGVEFSSEAFLRKEANTYRQPDRDCTQSV